MAKVNGMKSYRGGMMSDSDNRKERETTYKEASGFRMYVKKNEGKTHCQANPKNDKTKNEADKGRYGREVTECFRSQKPGKGILFHGSEAILLLSMEHIRDLSQHTEFLLRLGLILAVEGESMDSQGRRQVNLVTRVGVNCRREIAVEDSLCRTDEIETCDCC